MVHVSPNGRSICSNGAVWPIYHRRLLDFKRIFFFLQQAVANVGWIPPNGNSSCNTAKFQIRYRKKIQIPDSKNGHACFDMHVCLFSHVHNFCMFHVFACMSSTPFPNSTSTCTSFLITILSNTILFTRVH